MAVRGTSRKHPVTMDVLPSSSGVHRGVMETVPVDQLDLATSSHSYRRQKQAENFAYNNLTLQEVRYSTMRRKIPGSSTMPKNHTKMFIDLDPQTQFMNDLRQYIRQHFHMKECSMFVPAPGQKVKKNRDLKCHCGDVLMAHAGMQTDMTAATNVTEYYIMPKEIQRFISRKMLDDPPSTRLPQVSWNPASLRSTVTNAYGKVDFVNVEHIGGKKPAKYIRMIEDDSIDDLLHLMKEYWKIMEPQAPHLVISVVGGAKNFKLDGKMRDTFSTGLIKAAKTTSAWLISSGFNMGVMKAVGQAVKQGQSFCWDNNRMAHVLRCIGIAPWGYVKGRRTLESLDGQGKFNADFRTSNVILHGEPVPLNPDHTHFIFVDDGYRNRYGGVAGVRAKLEQKISKPESEGGLGIPVVLVVVEGGTDAIADAKTSIEHRIPVVVCAGTGRAADILSYAYSHTKTTTSGLREMRKKHISKLRDKIFDAYGKSWKDEEIDMKTESIKKSVQICCQNADLMIVFHMNKHEDLDLAILSVLLKAQSGGDEVQRLSQLKLALMWDRVDIAQEEIFREDVLWRPRSLDDFITEAIETEKVKFLDLILQQGVMVKEYLTRERLENLYLNIPKHNPLYHLLFQLTGKEEITRENVCLLLRRLFDRYDEDKDILGLAELDLEDSDVETFAFNTAKYNNPFKHLFIWAVLLNRQSMAMFFWEMGDEPVTSALAATRLYSAMARHLPRHEFIIKDKLITYKQKFEELATNVLNECNQKDPDKAMMIVERKSPCWNDMTCLQLAASSNDQLFMSSEGCQNSIMTTWKHGILSGWAMILLAKVCPPVIVLCMEIAEMGKEKMSWYQKLATYYTSPISKFSLGTALYLAFLVTFCYMVLVDFQPGKTMALEKFCVLWVFTLFIDKVHTFIAFPAPTAVSKFRDWYGIMNWLELANYFVCFLGFLLHELECHRATKVMYCLNSAGFVIGLTKVYTTSEKLGPKIVMIRRMMRELGMMLMVLFAFLLAYGVSSQGLLYHQRSPDWVILKDVIYFPYWQLYGEIYLKEIETDQCTPGDLDCRTYHELVPFLLAIYLLIGNILLVNLLIAIFSNVFKQVEKNNREIWKYEMYFLVMEYDNKTFLAPPFSIIVHIFLVAKWLLTRCSKHTKSPLIGRRHLENLQLFEKENMTNYLRHVKSRDMNTLEATVKRLQKRVDDLSKMIEDEVIADQHPDASDLASTLVMPSDGHLLHGGVSTDSFPRSWPSVQSVLDVSDKVVSSDIPPEFHRQRSSLLKRNPSSAGIVRPVTPVTTAIPVITVNTVSEPVDLVNQNTDVPIDEPDMTEKLPLRESRVKFDLDMEEEVKEEMVRTIEVDDNVKRKKHKKAKKKSDSDVEKDDTETTETNNVDDTEETLKDKKKNHKKDKKEKKRHRSKDRDVNESNVNIGINNINLPHSEQGNSGRLDSDFLLNSKSSNDEHVVVRPKIAPVRAANDKKHEQLEILDIDIESVDPELNKGEENNSKRGALTSHAVGENDPSRNAESPRFLFFKMF